jgi:hypothetical protein
MELAIFCDLFIVSRKTQVSYGYIEAWGFVTNTPKHVPCDHVLVFAPKSVKKRSPQYTVEWEIGNRRKKKAISSMRVGFWFLAAACGLESTNHLLSRSLHADGAATNSSLMYCYRTIARQHYVCL